MAATALANAAIDREPFERQKPEASHHGGEQHDEKALEVAVKDALEVFVDQHRHRKRHGQYGPEGADQDCHAQFVALEHFESELLFKGAGRGFFSSAQFHDCLSSVAPSALVLSALRASLVCVLIPGAARFALAPGYLMPRLRRSFCRPLRASLVCVLIPRGSALRARPWLSYAAPSALVLSALRASLVCVLTPGAARFALAPGYLMPHLRRSFCRPFGPHSSAF